MKDFTYICNGFNLNAYDCIWLKDMGLKETRWILDREWFFVFYSNKQLTFNEWVNDQGI